MASGYKFQDTDLDELFELWQEGDPKTAPTSNDVESVDFNDRFVDVSVGSPLPYPVGYSVGVNDTDLVGIDFSQRFAAKRSVPRYPLPLPWDRNIDLSASVYRQPSRPTLTTQMFFSMSVHRDGSVAISRTYPTYNSEPGVYGQDSVATTLWGDAGAEPNSPYQVRFDHLGGLVPTLAFGQPMGEWITLNTAPFNSTVFVGLNYLHAEPAGLKEATSSLRVSVRRSEYPQSNQANAVAGLTFVLNVEPSVYQNIDNNWTLQGGVNDAVTNYHQTSVSVNRYGAHGRVVIGNDGLYTISRAVSTNELITEWIVNNSRPFVRAGFDVADYEILVDAPNGGIVGVELGQWLSLSTTRTVVANYVLPDTTPPGTYVNETPVVITFREISTKGWAGLPDNTITSNFVIRNTVVIQPPNNSDWSDALAWTGDYLVERSVTRDPEDPNALTIARLVMTFYPDGVSQLLDQSGNLLNTQRWAPVGVNAAEYEMQVVAVSGNAFESNQLGNWTAVSQPLSATVAVGYQNSSVEGTYESRTNFNVNARRIAATSDSNTNVGSATARIVVAPPIALLTPIDDYDNWAGNYVYERIVQVGPPQNAIRTSGWGGTFNNDFSRAREISAPTQANMESYWKLSSTTDGNIILTRHRFFSHGPVPGTNQFLETTPTVYSIIDTSIGPAAAYQFRLVFVSGTNTGEGYTDWTDFGQNGIEGSRTFGINRVFLAETGTASISGTYRLEVRHRQYPSQINDAEQFQFNNSLTLTGAPVVGYDARIPLEGPYIDAGTVDSRNAPALVEFIWQSNGNVRVRTNYPSSQDVVVGQWTGGNATNANTQLLAEIVSQSGQVVIGNGAMAFTLISQDRIFSVETNDSGVVQVAFTLRDINNHNASVTKLIRVEVTRNNTGGPGGGGGDGNDPGPIAPELQN